MFTRILCIAAFMVSLCFVGSVFAANKVYPLDYRYGIVADDAEWTCAVSTAKEDQGGRGPLYLVHGQKYITGKANYLPVSFDFFVHYIDWSLMHPTPPHIRLDGVKLLAHVKNFLANYAQKSSTIFS